MAKLLKCYFGTPSEELESNESASEGGAIDDKHTMWWRNDPS